MASADEFCDDVLTADLGVEGSDEAEAKDDERLLLPTLNPDEEEACPSILTSCFFTGITGIALLGETTFLLEFLPMEAVINETINNKLELPY